MKRNSNCKVSKVVAAVKAAQAVASSPDTLFGHEREVLRLRSDKADATAKLSVAIQQIESLEKRVELLAGLKTQPKQKRVKSKPTRRKTGEATAILVLSDWHVEEPVYSAVVNGLNEFNLEIAEKRIAQTFEKALMLLEDARHLTTVNDMVVAVLGDLISGAIHEELLEANLLAPLPATMFAAEHLEQGLRMLLKHGKLDSILVPTANGNHGRTTARRRIATSADNSFEYNLYLHLAQRFANEPKIRWQIGQGYHNWVEVQGHQIRMHHGDAVRFFGGVGGLTIPMNKCVAQWNKSRRADFDVIGHHHSFKWDWNWLCNGSLIGYGAYSLEIKAEFQPPLQTFMVVDRQRGITRCLPIFCE